MKTGKSVSSRERKQNLEMRKKVSNAKKAEISKIMPERERGDSKKGK
jgi:hypothetical protein